MVLHQNCCSSVRWQCPLRTSSVPAVADTHILTLTFTDFLSLQWRSMAALLPWHYEFLSRLECPSLLKYQIFDHSESSEFCSGNLQTCHPSYLNSQRNPSLIQAVLLGEMKWGSKTHPGMSHFMHCITVEGLLGRVRTQNCDMNPSLVTVSEKWLGNDFWGVGMRNNQMYKYHLLLVIPFLFSVFSCFFSTNR